jgi:16S rRNA C967 or C1407 C5-methylase (RsmB/RsmF family)/transcription termination factor NusB
MTNHQKACATEAEGLAPRRLAWRVLEAVAAGAYADNALERELAKSNLATLDRGLATELAYGAIRQRRLLDAWIDAHGRLKAENQPPRLRWLLHIGLYQLLFSQRVPASAAVNTSVELAKEAGFSRLAPVVNGLLRAVARAHADATTTPKLGALDASAHGDQGHEGSPHPTGTLEPETSGTGSAMSIVPGTESQRADKSQRSDEPQGTEPQESESQGAEPEGTETHNAQTPIPPWQGLPMPLEEAESLALRHSLPPWLASQLLRWGSRADAEAFGEASNTPPCLDLRINRRRCSRAEALAAFEAAGVTAKALHNQEWGVSLPMASGDLRALPGFREGHWCVQDRVAQSIAPLLAPQSGQRVLDACAAPGGKATHLAELMGDQGEIWAVDRSESRLKKVGANAERLGLTSIRVLSANAAHLADLRPDWLGCFDRLLIDAPCSGLGTLARHADARWRMQPEAIASLAEQQLHLLEQLAPLLRPDGRLVYATCTIHPRENSEVVAGFLASHPHWSLIQQQQWWPVPQGGDGFYVAVLAPQHQTLLDEEAKSA